MGKNNFHKVAELIEADSQDVRYLNTLVSANKAKGGGHVTIGVPEPLFSSIMTQFLTGSGEWSIGLLVVRRSCFDEPSKEEVG